MSKLEPADGLACAEACAKNHGGQFLSTAWQGTEHRYSWRCICGETWRAVYSLVVSHGTWCPRCATNYKARIRRKSESAAWDEFDKTIAATWPNGSHRVTAEFPGTHHSVEVHCGHCSKTHRPTWRNIAKRAYGPACLRGQHVSTSSKGKAKLDLRLPGDAAAFRQRLRVIKMGAKSRGLEFDLDEDLVRNLILADCFWCGKSPFECGKITFAHGRRFSGEHGVSFGPCIGIDRIDNSVGYVPGNVVPACEKCNVSKMNESPGDWLTWLSYFTPGRLLQIKEALLARNG